MLKIRVKHGDNIYINNKEFSIQVPSSKMCIVCAVNEKHIVKQHEFTSVEDINISFTDYDKGYVRLGFSGNDNVKVESENLWRKRNGSKKD